MKYEVRRHFTMPADEPIDPASFEAACLRWTQHFAFDREMRNNFAFVWAKRITRVQLVGTHPTTWLLVATEHVGEPRSPWEFKWPLWEHDTLIEGGREWRWTPWGVAQNILSGIEERQNHALERRAWYDAPPTKETGERRDGTGYLVDLDPRAYPYLVPDGLMTAELPDRTEYAQACLAVTRMQALSTAGQQRLACVGRRAVDVRLQADDLVIEVEWSERPGLRFAHRRTLWGASAEYAGPDGETYVANPTAIADAILAEVRARPGDPLPDQTV